MDIKKTALVTVMAFLIMATVSFAQPDDYCGDYTETTLYAGQTIDSGTVDVWNDAENLYVRFSTTDGWEMAETHLAVESSFEDIPQSKKGNPKVGHFEYSATHEPTVTEYTYVVDLGDVGDGYYIAAHAVVQKFDGDTVTEEETGWSDGNDFPGDSWAMYFDYTIQECAKQLNLPETVSMRIHTTPGTNNNYFDLAIWNVGTGYDIWEAVWTGWCVDSEVYIENHDYHNTTVYLSTDPNLATNCAHCVDDEQWDMVNYILNQDYEATGNEIQAAIWYFTETSPNYQGFWTDASQAIVNDTLANGAGYTVPPGGWVAVILDNGPNVQLTFIVVDP